MTKLFLSLVLTFALSLTAADSKQSSTIDTLFELMWEKENINRSLQPFFQTFNIEAAKQDEVVAVFMKDLKKEFIAEYEKYFTETELKELVQFYKSPVGKKLQSKMPEISTGMQKAYASLMSFVPNAQGQQEPQEPVQKSEKVIYFDQESKGKSDEQLLEQFAKEIQHEGITVVKFSATWCGPCRVYAPIFKEVVQELSEVTINGKKIAVKYIDVDVDEASAIAQQYSVRNLPTTIFFKNGKKMNETTGAIKKEELKNKINNLARA